MENTENTVYTPVEVSIKSLLDAGAHFGHKAERWNPKMAPFIFGQRNNIHIINLDLTLSYWERAKKYVTDISSRGGTFLFVGTKEQSKRPIREAAVRAGTSYITNRWLGGCLSNFQTIKKSTGRMEKIEEFLNAANQPDSQLKIAKKEKLSMARELEKLNSNLAGIRDMKRLPDVVFVIDVNKDAIAIAEAKKLHIPVVALLDTNCDPNVVDFPIPSNDDSAGSIALFANAMADAIIEGRAQFEARLNPTIEAKEAAVNN